VEAEVLRGARTDDRFSRPEGVGRLSGLDSWGVTGGFYDVVEPVVLAGRLPTDAELEAGEPVIVVSERVARAYWPDAQARGQSLSDSREKVPHTVIGVVRDVRWHGWDLESPMIYGPYSRLARSPFLTFFARTDGQTGRIISEAVRAIEEADPTIRPRTAATLDEMYRQSVALRRFQSWLFGGFAAAALAVVGAGIFGLLAMSTARRTWEIGVRCALGATARSVTVLLLREQIPVVVLGLIAGSIVSAWAVGFVEAYLYELTVTDPRIWASATAVVMLTALAGALVPAWRASRTDPLKALRVE
jgi:putative ABC transport system permease protein